MRRYIASCIVCYFICVLVYTFISFFLLPYRSQFFGFIDGPQIEITPTNYKNQAKKLYTEGVIDSLLYQRLVTDSYEQSKGYIESKIEWKKNDSILMTIYQSGKFDHLIKHLNEEIITKDFKNDTLAVLRVYAFSMGEDYSILDFIKRSYALRKAYLSTGYKMWVIIWTTYWTEGIIGDSYFLLLSGALYAWWLNGAVWNPIMFICFPLAGLILIFSKKRRRLFGQIVQKLLNKYLKFPKR